MGIALSVLVLDDVLNVYEQCDPLQQCGGSDGARLRRVVTPILRTCFERVIRSRAGYSNKNGAPASGQLGRARVEETRLPSRDGKSSRARKGGTYK
jgi:hypothetical protein